MWLKKLKSNKLQFIFVAVMLFIIAAVFSGCVCFTLELKTYAKDRFSSKYCPDVYVYSLKNNTIEGNFPELSVQNNIKDIAELKGKNISVPLKHKGKTISSITNILCTLEDTSMLQYIHFLEKQNNSAEPGDGEVWITRTLANSYHIKIGDTLTIMYENPVELKVTEIYTSTFAPSERLTIMPAIINEETLKLFSQEEDAGIFALNLYDTTEKSIDEIAMTNPYSLITFSRHRLELYVTNITNVVGSVASIAGFIVFLASLFIIRFIMNDNLRKEIHSIGIYKSIGMTSESIRNIYIMPYMFIGVISIIAGILCSMPVVYQLGVSSSQAMMGFSLTKTTAITCIVAIVLLLFVLWFVSFLSLRKVKDITPYEAITVGQSSGEDVRRPSVIKNAKSSFDIAVNDIFKHRKSSLISFCVLVFSVYLILFFSSSYTTCTSIYEKANIWLACPKFNTIVTGNITEDVKDSIQKSNYVQSVVCGNFFYYPPVDLQQYDGNSRNIQFLVLDDLDEKKTDIQMKEGRNPETDEEVCVSKVLLSQMNLEVGDYLKIALGNKEYEYLICGSFYSMEELSINMTVGAMKKIDESYEPDNCFVRLKDTKDFNSFRNEIEGQYSEIVANKDWVALKYAIKAIESMLSNIMKVMLIVFILFSIISIVNILALTIQSKKRQYGILKALGFTTNYIIGSNLIQTFLLFGASTVIAMIIHVTCSKKLFELLVIDAMSHSVCLMSILLGFTAFAIIVVTLLLSRPIRKITPVDLMEE